MPTTSERRRRSGDRGFSAIEVVVGVMLMGIVILPIIDAVRVNIKASSVSHSAAKIETAIVNAADRVNRAPLNCPIGAEPGGYEQYVKAAIQVEQWDPALATTEHFHLDSNTDQWLSGVCAGPGTPPDNLVQLVRITLTTPDRKVSRTIEVVKSNV